MSTNFDEDEISKNLARFTEQQIEEYKYVQSSRLKQNQDNRTLDLDIPNLNAPKSKRKSMEVSMIDINSENYRRRRYEDDLDDDLEDDLDDYEEERPAPRRRPENNRNERISHENRISGRRQADRRRPVRPDITDYDDSATTPAGAGGKVKKKKKLSTKQLVIRIVAGVLAFIVLLVALWYFLVGAAYDKMTYKPVDCLKNANLEDDGITNILLLGSDTRTSKEGGRSDVNILMTINKHQNKVYLTSFLRDCYVDIPGYGKNRLNAAFSKGGADLAVQTIEKNFGVDINRYMMVDFQAFANLGDAVGGIDLEVTAEEVDYINAYLWEYNELIGRDTNADNFPEGTSGKLHLNGPQALAYCRNRYIGTDFARTDRQKKVISAIIKKLPIAAITNIGGVMGGLFPNLTTDLLKDDAYKLSLMVFKLAGMEIVQNNIPLDNTFKNEKAKGMAVLGIDLEANKKFIQDVVLAKKAPVATSSSAAK